MMRLALKTVLYEWRRYLPAVIAVGFSGLLVLLQAAVVLGIFSLSSLYVTRSTAELWVGFPGVQSIDLGRPIAERTSLFMGMNPHIRKIEPFVWGSGEWRTERHGMVNVYLVGIDTRPDGIALAQALIPAQRAALASPGAVLIDEADFGKLGARAGDAVEINGRRVRVVGATHGLRALGGVNVIASLATTRSLDPASGPGGDVAYFLARTDDPAQAPAIAAALNTSWKGRGFEAMTADQFARRTTRYWLAESGAGAAFAFGSVVAILVAVIITSQTLVAAVAASIKDYAALRALGFPMSALRTTVMGQTLCVGVVGAMVAGALTVGLAAFARAQSVPMVLSQPMVAGASLLVLAVALISGLFALRRVGQADPMTLLL